MSLGTNFEKIWTICVGKILRLNQEKIITQVLFILFVQKKNCFCFLFLFFILSTNRFACFICFLVLRIKKKMQVYASGINFIFSTNMILIFFFLPTSKTASIHIPNSITSHSMWSDVYVCSCQLLFFSTLIFQGILLL